MMALAFGAFALSTGTRVGFIALCGVLACRELGNALKKLKRPALWAIPCICIVFTCAALLFYNSITVVMTALAAAMMLTFAAVMFSKKGTDSLFSTLGMLVYPALPIGMILYIASGKISENLIIFATGLASSILCDTFALFSGMAFGKHKLAPAISPKKTIEGSIGGSLITVIIALNVWLFWDYFNTRIGLLPFLGCVLCCTVAGQIGDLAASYIKRAAKIKDYSKLIPGHGGILDRIDSMLFSIPTAMIFFMLFS